MRKSQEYRAAHKEGRVEADRALKDEYATISNDGLGESFFDNLDRETGLRYSCFGWLFGETIMGRIDEARTLPPHPVHNSPARDCKLADRAVRFLDQIAASR